MGKTGLSFDAYPLMVVDVKSDIFPVLFRRLLLNGLVFELVFGTSVKYVPVNKNIISQAKSMSNKFAFHNPESLCTCAYTVDLDLTRLPPGVSTLDGRWTRKPFGL